MSPRQLPSNNHWHLTDSFTVEQAACLWCDVEPGSIGHLAHDIPDSVAAIKQMLVGAVVTGELSADRSTNALSFIGDHSKTLIQRGDLEGFARRKGVFPRFLFDTLTPNQEAPEPQLPRKTENNSRSVKGRGGRPEEYDWDAFILEIIKIANSPDGLPPTQARLVQTMLQWFSDTSGVEPAESTVKKRISRIYNYLWLDKNSND